MSTDSAKVTDDVTVELNGDQVTSNLPALERPADGALKAKWVDYAVALGADRAWVEGEDYTVADLRDLADRLGG